jgi:hypothetical protein
MQVQEAHPNRRLANKFNDIIIRNMHIQEGLSKAQAHPARETRLSPLLHVSKVQKKRGHLQRKRTETESLGVNWVRPGTSWLAGFEDQDMALKARGQQGRKDMRHGRGSD